MPSRTITDTIKGIQMNKMKSDGAYSIWSALILLCVVLAVFALVFASCAFGGGSETPSPSPSASLPPTGGLESPDISAPDTSGAPPVQNTSVELGETEDMGQEYIDKFVFLGDSTTNGLAAYDVVNKNQVWTPANGTLTINRWDIDRIQYRDEGTEIFITEALEKKKPEYLLVTLGVNGVSFLDEENFTMYYKALIEAMKAASPDTKIILNTIYPVSAGYDPNTGITNGKIDAANGWIKNIAEDTGVKFLNSASILKDETGAMKVGYDNGDNIHPNADTYRLIISYIRTHGYM